MKVLTLDIETSPHESYTWGVWQQNVAAGQMIRPGGMITWAAHWKGDRQREVIFRTCEDEDFLTLLRELLNEADLVVGYNHDKFDLRHIGREFVEAGLFPPRPVATVDLLKVVKRQFYFPHYRLDYVAARLLGIRKLDTGGFELWPAWLAGDPKARLLMRRYNIKDVVITEKLYEKLLPWVHNHPYTGYVGTDLGDEDTVYECPACGSSKTTHERPRRTRCFAIRLVSCRNCGAWSDGKRRKMG